MMISVQAAIAQFKAIIGTAPSWITIARSQFVDHLAIFVSWALRDALWKIERVVQEFFLSTAINSSSVRAHAEDREYIPRKATPSRGKVRITNNGPNAIVIPDNTCFISPAQVEYLIETSVGIDSGLYAEVSTAQLSLPTPITEEILTEQPYYEIMFPVDTSAKLAAFQVFVDQGSGYEEWEYARLFQNAFGDDQVYDEFYSHKGQTGIRFGNGDFGKIPPLNSVVKIEYTTTDGDTSLITDQVLTYLPSDSAPALLDTLGIEADITVTIIEEVVGGAAAESISEMRKSLHYWPSYNHKLIWDDDYIFFLKRTFPTITWGNCWGEQEQEIESVNGFDVQNINKIFVTAYAPGKPELPVEAMAALATIPLLNRKFQWVDPLLSTFKVTVTGVVSRSTDIPSAITAIKSALETDYGAASKVRVDTVRISDVYDLVKKSGFFDDRGAYYQVTISGITSATWLREMVSVDVNGSTFNLTHQ